MKILEFIFEPVNVASNRHDACKKQSFKLELHKMEIIELHVYVHSYLCTLHPHTQAHAHARAHTDTDPHAYPHAHTLHWATPPYGRKLGKRTAGSLFAFLLTWLLSLRVEKCGNCVIWSSTNQLLIAVTGH